MLRPFPASPARPRIPAASRAAARLPVTVSLALLGIAHAAWGQAKRCDLVGQDTVVSGTGYKKCLDLAALDGDTLVIPRNVTRIDNDGLSLCKSAVTSGGNADIVYVYDNSGSMRADFAWVSGADTAFFENRNGCSDTVTTGTVSYSVHNASGTGQVTRTVRRLRSRTNCTSISGDPYYARGTAIRMGINYQAERAPTSTAGIMSFTGTTANVRRPLALNTTANISTIQSGINVVSDGGTNYRPPLDTSKRWLTTSITPNPKKAIIFVSDGRHNAAGQDYLAVLDTAFDRSRGFGGAMPPIYGIYMGQPVPDTANLAELSRRTGGRFFLIPPRRPDSLVSVIEQILDVVLREYEPVTATVTNAQTSQSATSTAPAGFTLQTSGSWLMRLSDVVALSGNDTNRITVTTQFKERNSNTTESQTISFLLMTTAPAAGSSGIITGSQFARTCYDRSRLTILNRANQDPPFFTEVDSGYQPMIRTSPIDLASLTSRDTSWGLDDRENAVLPRTSATADSMVFRATLPFRVTPSAARGNGTLQANVFDTLVVSWTHPRDPQDVAADTMRVRAANAASEAWFSDAPGGARVATFPSTQEWIYVVVSDQRVTPGMTYQAVITNERLGVDRETVTLDTLGGGLLGTRIQRTFAGKTAEDGVLQIFPGGDQLRVVYRDPVYGDTAEGKSGYSEDVQEVPAIAFTDADGNILDSAAVWPPSRGKLHVIYHDDYASGRVASKPVSLTLVSRRYGAALGTDRERVTVDMVPHTSGTRAAWRGSIDLADVFPARDSNGRAETRYRGEAAIVATAHDNAGAAQALTVSDFLLVANPDSQATLTWTLADSGQTPAGTEGLILTVRDQDFSVAADDSVRVSVICARSGDSVSAVAARETAAGSGTYRTGAVTKDEGVPNPADRLLSCLSADQIVVRYVDPVYGTTAQLTVNEVARPIASPAGRRFALQEFVTLSSATPGAVIHYTLDGSTPKAGVSSVYSGPITVSRTTTLKAIAVLPGWKDSKVMTETYVKEAFASRLEFLDENGNLISGGYLTGAAKAVRLKLTTTQANLPAVEVETRARVSGDDEDLQLSNSSNLGNVLEYWQTVALGHDSAMTAGNGALETRGTDTLIAVWTNPLDPADVARDTLVVKPAFVAAEVYFSLTAGGPRITTYPVNQDTVFIVVKTRPRDPSLTYQVTVTSNEPTKDTEILDLVELSPGVFSAKVPVGSSAKTAGDKVLQVSAAGDQLTAVFVDPVYKDAFRGDAGFAQQVQESAALDFIHPDGRLVAPDEIWSPALGRVYLRYSDDWNAGISAQVDTLLVRLNLVNKKTGAVLTTDEEDATLTLVSQTATRGTWEGSVLLRDRAATGVRNDTLETHYRGELAAVIQPHNNAGQKAGAEVTDNLVIAYPNQPAEILVRDTSGKAVDRPTDRVAITVKDQPHTSVDGATITVNVRCEGSGDVVSSVRLVWDGTAYVAVPPVAKGEGNSANASDSVLTCKSTDRILVTYTDPVYGDVRTGEARWSDQKAARVSFASTRDSSAITSVSDGVDKDFLVVVEGVSPTRDRVDTVTVVITTAQGEKVQVKAVETGVLTGLFRAKVDFAFTTAAPDPGNGRLEARINADQRSNRVIATAEAQLADAKPTADIALFSAYALATAAYMQDVDGDGRADRAVFIFDQKLARLPSGLDEVYWNRTESSYRQAAAASQLSFRNADSNVVVADFSKSPFGLGLTGIPSGQRPYALFPADNLYGAQKAPLADSVGPVPVTAVKYASNMNSYSVSDTEKRFYPDTLVVEVSEELTTSSNWIHMLRFSKGCVGYGESLPLKLGKEPERVGGDPLRWLLIVDNGPDAQIPLVGDCVYLERDGRYTDVVGNRPGVLGVPITGENARMVIRDFRGFPPVAGVSPDNPAVFVVANSDSRGADGSRWSTRNADGTWNVVWIPPAGFDPNDKDPVGSVGKMVPEGFDPKAQPKRDIEAQSFVTFPTHIAAVQVIATGRYIARISIYDNLGNFVRSMVQGFGFWGEEKNPWRATDKGLRSFLIWDLKDHQGRKVGQGAYVWKVHFAFSEKKSEVMYTRTGVLRP